MATKKSTEPIKKEQSTIIYDEVISLPDNQQLRMVFDLAEGIQKTQQYAEELKNARRIPFDIENLSPRDPVVTFMTQQFMPQIKAKLMDENDILYRVQQFYRKAEAETQRDASLIVLFSHPDNQAMLAEDPEPYEDRPQNTDPLLVQTPEIKKNLAWPTERRLKRLMDVLVKTGAIFRVEQLLEGLTVRMNVFAQGLVEVDESGFQPATIDG